MDTSNGKSLPFSDIEMCGKMNNISIALNREKWAK